MTVPGLSPIPFEQWSEAARAVLPRFLRRPELYLSGGPDAQPMPQALRLFAHHVELGAAWMGFTEMLAGEHATLEPSIREIAILRVAWDTGSTYEWKQHTRIALRSGLATEHLYAVAAGTGSPVWTSLQRAVVAAADQIVDSHEVAAGTWQELAEHLEAAQLLELLFVIGGYACFAAVTNSVRLEPDPPTEPVDAPDVPGAPRRP